VRRDAQTFFVVDVSRSMDARAAKGPTRLARAIRVAERLRQALPDVPGGIATLTDRLLPNLFPSGDASGFARVAERSLAIDQPPPAQVRKRSTDFGALTQLVLGNYFGPHARRRLVVLLTDGESVPFDLGHTARSLREARIGLIVVRFWRPDERVYAGPRAVETAYRPDAAATARAGRLGSAVSGLPPFAEGELAAAAAAARTLLGHGPTGPAPGAVEERPLAPYLAAAAWLPLALLLLGRSVRVPRAWRRSRTRVPAVGARSAT
jgi:hypothetical protein